MKHHIRIHGGPGTGKSLVLKMLAGRLAERLGYDPGVILTRGSGDGTYTPPIAILDDDASAVEACLAAIDQVPTEWLVITTGYQPDHSAACNVELCRTAPLNLTGGINTNPLTFAGLPDDVWLPVKAWVDKQRAKRVSEVIDAALPSPPVANRRSRI